MRAAVVEMLTGGDLCAERVVARSVSTAVTSAPRPRNENWESENLQMAVFVLLTTFLSQKGSPESRRPGHKGTR